MTLTNTNTFELDDIILVTKDIFLPLLGSKPYLTKGSLLKIIKTDYYDTNLGDYNMMTVLKQHHELMGWEPYIPF